MLDTFSLIQRLTDELLNLFKRYIDFWVNVFVHPTRAFYVIVLRHRPGSRRLSPNAVSAINVVLIIVLMSLTDYESGVLAQLASAVAGNSEFTYGVHVLAVVVVFALLNYLVLRLLMMAVGRFAPAWLLPRPMRQNIYEAPLLLATSYLLAIIVIALIAVALFGEAESEWVYDVVDWIPLAVGIVFLVGPFQLTAFARRRWPLWRRAAMTVLVDISILIPAAISVVFEDEAFPATPPVSTEIQAGRCFRRNGAWWIYAIVANKSDNPAAIVELPISIAREEDETSESGQAEGRRIVLWVGVGATVANTTNRIGETPFAVIAPRTTELVVATTPELNGDRACRIDLDDDGVVLFSTGFLPRPLSLEDDPPQERQPFRPPAPVPPPEEDDDVLPPPPAPPVEPPPSSPPPGG